MRQRLKAGWVPFFYALGTAVTRFLLMALTRWHVSGRRNVPAGGPVIVVSNHLSNYDPVIIGAGILRRRIRWMAKIELFKGFVGVLGRWWGAFPVRRFEADMAALLNAERILRHEGVLGMFPEGTRARDGRMGPPLPGTALIALRTGATVLPCAITGTDRLRKPAGLLKRPRVTVTLGKPIAVTAVRRPSEAQVSALTNRIFADINALLPAAYRAAYTQTEGSEQHDDGNDSSSERDGVLHGRTARRADHGGRGDA